MLRTVRYGFSLVELSIVLAILGIVAAGGLSVGTTLVDQQANIASDSRVEEINKALQAYFAVNGYLPCPADPNADLGTSALGLAANNNVCDDSVTTNAAMTAANITIQGTVLIGDVPTRRLGLRDRMIADEFGNRYTYAVSRLNTTTENAFTLAATGAITVVDGGNNNIATDVSYIVVSHGSDGKGARRYQAGGPTVPVACGATAALDVQNCDNANATFRDTRFNNGSVVASFYDDFTRWMPYFRLSLTSTGGGGLWEANAADIYAVGSDGQFNTGNVGIGTDTPTSPFHLVSASNVTFPLTTIEKTGAVTYAVDNSPLLTLRSATAANDPVLMRFEGSGVHNTWGIKRGGNTQVLTVNTTATPVEAFAVTNTGLVGIGTTAPSALLHVRSAAASATLNLQGAGGNWQLHSDNAANWFRIYDNGSNARFTISPTGMVGIGTSTASTVSRLTVASGATSIAQIGELPAPCGNYAGITLGQAAAPVDCSTYNITSSTTNQDLFLNRPAGRAMHFREGNTTSQMTILTGGEISIPATGKLSVGATSADKLTVGGDVLANNYYLTSDARLKHDIKPAFAEAALEALAGIKPVYFVWNKDNKKDIGIIAQDVEKVMPDAVSIDDKGFRRVAYDKLVLPVIAAVKELHQMVLGIMDRITKLEEQITALQKENAELKARLERVEHLLEEDKSHTMNGNK